MSVLRATLPGACLLFLASGLAAETVERDFDRTFDVASGHRLHLEHGDGDVTIEAWEQDKLDVQVRYRAEYTRIGVGSEIDFDVEFRQDGAAVRVIGRESGSWSIGFFSQREIEHRYTIRAPSYLILDLDGDDGDVEISDWRGEITIRSEDGDLDLADIRSPRTDLSVEDGDIVIDRLVGELMVDAEDGDLRIADCTITGGRLRFEDGNANFSRCEGSVRMELADGDVVLERFRPEGIAIRTGDGDVDLDFLAGAAMDVEVRTEDGDVTVDLARGTSARLSIDTGDGAIRLDLPEAVDVRQGRSRASAQLGAGEGRLRIDTDDGRVVVRESS